MSARDDYPVLAARIATETHTGREASNALDEIDHLRHSVDELMAQIVAMQTADPQAIRTVVAGYWNTRDLEQPPSGSWPNP